MQYSHFANLFALSICFATYEYLDAQVCRTIPRISADRRYELLAWRRHAIDRASPSDQNLVHPHKNIEQNKITVKVNLH